MSSQPNTPADLSEVVDTAVNRLMCGQDVDLDALCAEHPDLRGQLKSIIPAVRAMAELGQQPTEPNGPQVEEHSPLPPKKLGDFRIVHEIGRGGMGVVYEAEQLSLRRRVALKVLPFASVLDPRHLQRFKNEAQAAAALRHPHIVSVHFVGCERGVHFYAMDLIEGQSLSEVIRDLRSENQSPKQHPSSTFAQEGAQNETQPMANLSTEYSTNRPGFFQKVAGLGIQAAHALQYAHDCGVLHRDIKPSNLMVDRGGKLWVTDFGLAMTQTSEELTITGDLIGTVRYMSPEQAAGDKAMIDHRTDIYSLGASLYELLSLRPAVEGNDRQTLLRQIDEHEPTRLRRIDASIPQDLEKVVDKAMAKQSHDRYATAVDFADDLQRFLDMKPVRVRRGTPIQKSWRWAKRKPKLAALAAFASLLALILAVGGPVTAVRQASLAEQLKTQLYGLQIGKAHVAVSNRDFETAAQILAELVPQAGENDLRSFHWFHLWQRCQRVLSVPTLTSDSALHATACSPDGRFLAVGAFTGAVSVHDATTLDEVWTRFYRITAPQETGHQDVVTDIAFTPDSRLLITVSRDATLKVWDAVTGELVRTEMFVEEGLTVSALAVWGASPDDVSPLVAVGFAQPDQASREQTHISVFRLAREGSDVPLHPTSSTPLTQGLIGVVHAVDISPDGKSLASCCSHDRIQIWDVETGKLARTLTGHFGTVRDVAFCPGNSGLLASASYADSVTDEGAGEVRLWNVKAGQTVKTLGRNTFTRCLAFSSDGQRLVSGDHEGVLNIWDIESRALLRTFAAHGLAVTDVAYVPKANRIVSASHDARLRVWDEPERTEQVTRIDGNGASVLKLAVSPDGQHLLAATSDGYAKLWNAETLELVAKIDSRNNARQFLSAAFSPDGESLALGGGHWNRPGNPLEFFVWDAERGARVLFAESGSNELGTIILGTAFSPDGKQVAAGIGSEIRFWNVRTGKPKGSIDSQARCVRDLAWSHATNRIAAVTTGPHTLQLWDGNTRREPRTYKIPPGHVLFRIDFSADGKQLAASTYNGTVIVYEVATGKRQRFEGHAREVTDVAFSPSGYRLASASKDRTVKLWNLDTGVAILTFREPTNMLWSVCFSPDGNTLYGASDHLQDSVIHVWRATEREMAAKQLGQFRNRETKWTALPSPQISREME